MEDLTFVMRSEQKLARARRRTRRRTIATVTVGAVAALGILTTNVAAAADSTLTDEGRPAGYASTPAAKTDALATALASLDTQGTSASAKATLAAAEAALADAAAVVSEMSSSGLDFGDAKTTIDTAPLAEAVEEMSDTGLLPAFLFVELAQTVKAQTEIVGDHVVDLRETLTEAIAEKAAADAAAAAAAEAQRQAEAAAEAQRQAEAAAAALAAVNTPAGAKSYAQQLAAQQYGWGGDQFSCLVSLWQKESGWNYQAYNPSGATGIPQALPGSKMASSGSDWQTNAATQIAWGLGYISSVYGAPCSAWGHSQATNWY